METGLEIMDTANCIETIFLYFYSPRWDPIENLQTIKVKGNTNTFLKYSKEHCKVDTKYKTSNTDHWTLDTRHHSETSGNLIQDIRH